MHAATSPVSVLLIDDQELAADMVREKLRGQPDIVLHYEADAAKALQACRALQPSVVLVDLKMPGIDGFDVLQTVRSDTAHLPLILLSSEESPDTKFEAFARGAHDYLVKWPDTRELLARVRYHAAAYRAHCERDAAFASLRTSQEVLLRRTQELAQSQAALQQAKKMEAIGQLTGGVAHDFNNVLQIISGNLEILRLLAHDNPAALHRINAAMEGVNRGARLSSHLLAFARRQPLQATSVDIGRLLFGMEELLRRALGHDIEVHTEVSDALWEVLADAIQLENVILNLALNARDAMREGGRLVLRACNAAAGAAEADAGCDEDGDYVMIEVADSGSGMSREVLERVFEPFFTTKLPGQGTGLGLSMAYGFVKQSGGQIRIDSTPGQGTTVRIFLPRAQQALQPAAVSSAGAAVAQFPAARMDAVGQRGRILVVDDEAAVRETAAAWLESLGYAVWQAHDGASALALIEGGLEVDLLFTDVIMPGPVRSSALVGEASVRLPGLKVLYTSGFPEGELAHDGRLAPDVRLLKKPYAGEALAREVAALLAPVGTQHPD
ncbi:MAG TPA: response regulator [Noviherbaspirillum sp.]